MGLKLNVQSWLSDNDHRHEILASLKSNVKHVWILSGLRFSMTHIKCKFIPPDNITDVSGTAVAHAGFDPLFWPTPGHKQEATYRICMRTSTHNRACFAPQKHTEIHILDISIRVLYETCSSYRFVTWNGKKKKTKLATALDLELKWLGKNSNFFQLFA